MDINHYFDRIKNVRPDLVYVGLAGLCVAAAAASAGAIVSQKRLEKKMVQGISGEPGPSGPQGAPGPRGPRGPKGDNLIRFGLTPEAIEAIPEDVTDKPIDVQIVEDEPMDVDASWESECNQDAPYVISYDEFHKGDPIGTQMCLEYFARDDILCDMEHTPIYNVSQVVGDLNFGQGSQDPDVVYVRNEKLGADYEITRRDELYQVAVLGAQIEDEAELGDLKHSDRLPKFHQE